MYQRTSGFRDLTPVVKNLLLANVAVFIVSEFVAPKSMQVTEIVVRGYLWPIESGEFRIWQPITHLFLHGGFGHIFFNMFSLWVFGSLLENLWGSKRFFNFYLICGLAAAAAHLLTSSNPALGASGAVMGVMVAFAYLFPNTELYIYGVLPVKAKYLVGLLVLVDLFAGLSNTGDQIAHWAHLGGALAGFLIVLYWNKSKKNKSNFY
jgi:membrane associated rhomboid family serine protease